MRFPGGLAERKHQNRSARQQCDTQRQVRRYVQAAWRRSRRSRAPGATAASRCPGNPPTRTISAGAGCSHTRGVREKAGQPHPAAGRHSEREKKRDLDPAWVLFCCRSKCCAAGGAESTTDTEAKGGCVKEDKERRCRRQRSPAAAHDRSRRVRCVRRTRTPPGHLLASTHAYIVRAVRSRADANKGAGGPGT